MLDGRTVSDSIVSILSTVPGVGHVYPRERWATNWDDMFTLFKDVPTGTLRAFQVIRRAVTSDSVSESIGVVSRWRHSFSVSGILSHSDKNDSDKIFQNLIDSVLEKLVPVNDSRLVIISPNIYIEKPPSISSISLIQFGDVLVHLSEIDLEIIESQQECI